MEISSLDREAWLAARLGVLSASEVAVALGMEPGRAKLVKVKAALVEADPDGEIGALAQVAAGRHMEAGIFSWFLEDTLHDVGAMHGRLVYHPTIARLGATPDAVMDEMPVELKMVGPTATINWFRLGQKSNVWEDLGLDEPTLVDVAWRTGHDNTITSDDKDDLRTLWRRKRQEQNELLWQLRRGGFTAPPKYIIQNQVQMACLGARYGWIVGCLMGTSRIDLLYQRSDALLDTIEIETHRFNQAVDKARGRKA